MSKAKYSVDDRGNVVQFYEVESDEIVAELDREATVDGKHDQLTWYGGAAVTRWARANGYAKEIDKATRV